MEGSSYPCCRERLLLNHAGAPGGECMIEERLEAGESRLFPLSAKRS
jgi:hypothetical protein